MSKPIRKTDKASPGFLIRRLQQIAVSIFIDALREFEITPMQYTILKTVRDHPGIDQITVAKLAALDTSTTTDVVRRLVQKGLLGRTPGERDKRTLTLTLTAEGQQLLADCRPAVQKSRRALLHSLTSEEREIFLTGLRKIVDSHEKADSAAGATPWRRRR